MFIEITLKNPLGKKVLINTDSIAEVSDSKVILNSFVPTPQGMSQVAYETAHDYETLVEKIQRVCDLADRIQRVDDSLQDIFRRLEVLR